MKRKIFLFLAALVGSSSMLLAQNAETLRIESALRALNSQTTAAPSMIVSYPGLDQFMATKVASYLSDGGDLSLFKNYAVLDTKDGRLSINHNFARRGPGTSVHSLLTVGVRANIASAFSSIVADSKFTDEIGAAVKYTWIGNGLVRFDGAGVQKMRSNSARGRLLTELIVAMRRESAEYEAQLLSTPTNDLSANDTFQQYRSDSRAKFYSALQEKYDKKFAEEEAKLLDNRELNLAGMIATGWVSVSAYFPITSTDFNVAESFEVNFSEQKLYPWEFGLTANGIIESRRFGRWFFKIGGSIVGNNSVKTKAVATVDLNSYKDLGGTDTLSYALLESAKAYVGGYEEFVTPIVQVQVVWFPPTWYVGMSASLEQNIGKYNPLNGKLGIPVRLKGKGDNSFVNFEIQARFIDLRDKLYPEKSHSKKTTVGISVGLPFSSLIY